jgi:surface protein
MNNLFFNCIGLKSLDLGNFDTRLVTDMNSMFYGCTSLKSINLSSFKTEKVENMKSMFFNCIQLESLNLSSFNTSKVTNMNMMFSGCVNLKYINFSKYEDYLNIATFNIFYGAHENLILYINNLNYPNIINLIPELSSMRCMTNNYTINSKNIYKVINDRRICLMMKFINMNIIFFVIKNAQRDHLLLYQINIFVNLNKLIALKNIPF